MKGDAVGELFGRASDTPGARRALIAGVQALRLGGAAGTALRTTTLFLAASSVLFLLLGKPPLAVLGAMLEGSFGSGFALSETLVKASPILLAALATALPARLGLISVGAEGQLFVGAIFGTAYVLAAGDRLGALTLPAMLLASAVGGALWGAVAGVLRALLRANETITTLLLNYVAPLLVDYLVYGPWKDPNSLGWPATASFPEAARLPSYFGTRVHLGLALGVTAVVLSSLLLTRTKIGIYLDLLRENAVLARRAGLSFARATVITLAVGGAVAGIAGMCEASVVEARLQSGVGAGAGYAGFLVAFLARGRMLALLPLTLAVAGLAAAGDNLQLAFDLPSSIVFVLQGALFAASLVEQERTRRRRALLPETA